MGMSNPQSPQQSKLLGMCFNCGEDIKMNQVTFPQSQEESWKESALNAAQFSNFCQKMKMLLWGEGFVGEEKMNRVALKLWKYASKGGKE